MTLVVILLLLALLFGGFGFVVHALWWIGVIALVGCGIAYLTATRRP
ncbi:MAG TPA: hypothetical protein VFW64_12180 [Pseudonocardiaceae bacterium]|nr:hypothetical protein [Pseudonocardiaceae bacterium]